ncbi:MAG: sigma-70 family RNA polymerase sigma factor [Candidatus Latescibacterota bacterium]
MEAFVREESAQYSQYSQLVEIYLRDVGHCEPLSREEEVELFTLVRQGDEEAMRRVIRANLLFVVSVAREYTHRGLPLIDLISEGNWGLLEAVRRFDETRGFKFITYAVWWIRQAILKALTQTGKAIRQPSSRLNDLQRMEREAQELSQSLGRLPTMEEILATVSLSEERVQNALDAGKQDLSLEAPYYRDGEEGLGSFLAAEEEQPDDGIVEDQLCQALERSMRVLDPRENRIIRTYFGLGGEKPMTLEQIGAVLGLTRERVRQLRDRGLRKMRQICGEELVDFSTN